MNLRTRGDKAFDSIIIVILAVVGVATLYPLYFVCIASISEPQYIASGEVFFYPRGLNTYAYVKLLQNTNIWVGYRNSLFYTVFGTLINLVFTLPAAFALSRRTLPFRPFFNTFFIITMYFGGGLIPSYMLNQALGLVNTIWVLLIPGAVSAYNLIIARSFYANSIPDSIFESAIIDGASKTRFFLQFALPLSTAMTAVIALYYALGHWNSYVTPMIYITDSSKQTLQVFIKLITATVDTTLAEELDPTVVNRLLLEKQLLKYAVIVVSSIPMVVLYPFVQRHFVKGVMIGAVKG